MGYDHPFMSFVYSYVLFLVVLLMYVCVFLVDLVKLCFGFTYICVLFRVFCIFIVFCVFVFSLLVEAP